MMKGIFAKELEEIEQLIVRGKYNVSQGRIDSIMDNEKATEEEKIRCKIFRAQIHFETFPYSEVIKYGEEAFEESKKLNNKQLMFDSVIVLPIAYFRAGEYELRKEKVKLASQILDSFDDKDSEEYLKRKAKLLLHQGDPPVLSSLANIEESIDISKRLGLDLQLAYSYRCLSSSYLWSGELKKAQIYAQKALELAEKLEYFTEIDFSTHFLAAINLHMGELDIALDYSMKALSICEETDDPYSYAGAYMDLGYLYWLKRDLKTALNYYQKSSKSFREAKIVGTRHYPWVLFRMNLVLIELEEYEKASRNLELIELLYLVKNMPIFRLFYNLAKAVLLKTKTDEESWNEATIILEEVADEEIVYLELNGLVIFHLCDVYLKKIQKSNDLNAFEKLKDRIQNLTEMAKEQKSHILLVQSLLLRSKLELIDLNIEKSQSLLEKAQSLAEEKGIINLAKIVSNEFDILLDQLSTWEDMSKYLPSLEERFEFTHIEDYLNRMMREYIIHESVVDEQESPQFLLILDKEGSILFSEQFNDLKIEKELLQEILSTVDVFKSDESLTSDSTKRIKYRNYTLTINLQGDLLIIYAFIGKSYHALKKLRSLIDEFKTFTGHWNVFFEKMKENKELTYSERKQLSEHLEGIFI